MTYLQGWVVTDKPILYQTSVTSRGNRFEGGIISTIDLGGRRVIVKINRIKMFMLITYHHSSMPKCSQEYSTHSPHNKCKVCTTQSEQP